MVATIVEIIAANWEGSDERLGTETSQIAADALLGESMDNLDDIKELYKKTGLKNVGILHAVAKLGTPKGVPRRTMGPALSRDEPAPLGATVSGPSETDEKGARSRGSIICTPCTAQKERTRSCQQPSGLREPEHPVLAKKRS